MTVQREKKQIRISDIIISKYQDIFNDTTYKHIILTSGRAAIKADYQIVSDPHGSVVVLRKHHNKLRKTVYKEILRGIKRLGIPKSRFYITRSPMEITYKKHGTTIYFSGSDGIDDTKGIIDEDKPIKLVVIDELTEFFDDGEGKDELANIEATFVRGNSGGFQMVYLYNPPKNPNAQINRWCREMEKREDCIHIHTDYTDVPATWLGPDLIASAEAMKEADEKMYRYVWLGQSVGVDAGTHSQPALHSFIICSLRNTWEGRLPNVFTRQSMSVEIMVSKMRRRFKHLGLIHIIRCCRVLESITTLAERLESRKARLNTQKSLLSLQV